MSGLLQPSRWIHFVLISILVLVCGSLLSACNAVSSGAGHGVQVVAAENQYGDMAKEVGGPDVTVTSLLNSPNVDPHQYEASPSVARSLASAGVVIENGLGYDSWMDSILAATKEGDREVINVGALLGRHIGDNPHIWYDPAGWPAIASALAKDLSSVDPQHATQYRARARRFVASLAPLNRSIASVRRHARGVQVTATEPVYGYMAEALGLRMRNTDFQLAIMNENDPSPGSVVRLEHDLQTHRVRILFFNGQTASPITKHMQDLARQNGVAVIGVTETMPSNLHFGAWQLTQLRQVARGLNITIPVGPRFQ